MFTLLGSMAQRSRTLGIVIAVCLALCPITSAFPSHVQAADSRAQGRPLQLESVEGSVRSVLILTAEDRGVATVRLWENRRPLTSHHVLLTLSRLRHSPVVSERMQQRGSSYRAALRISGAGWWEVAILLSDGGKNNAIPFLIHYSSSRGIVSGYPLLAPVGSMRPAITLPLGRELVTLHLTIGALGNTMVTVHNRSAGKHGQVRITVSMLDMLMPRTTVTARQVASNQYTTHVFLSMPGLWQLEVSDDRGHAVAALLIGKPNQFGGV